MVAKDSLLSPREGLFPTDHTQGERPFQVVGIDYAGPLQYKHKHNLIGKAYLLLFSCSLTRAVYLELVPDQIMEQFLICLKRFIAGKEDQARSTQTMEELSSMVQNG